MNINEIPFGKHLQIKDSEAPYQLELEDNPIYKNHLGTVAAAALFSLAEFAAGKALMDAFPQYVEKVIPVLRKADVRFKKPGFGAVKSKAELCNQNPDEILKNLESNGRTLIEVKVVVVDDANLTLMTGNYEWFLALKS